MLGLGLSIASCATVGKAAFTMSGRDSVWSIVVVGAGLLFLPLVIMGLVLPRIGGPALVLLSAAVCVWSLPATESDVTAAFWVNLVLALPMLVVGAGFTWSGLRPETRPEMKGGLA